MRAVVIGLLLGIAGSSLMALAAYEHRLADALPSPWYTASFGIGVLAVGWVLAIAWPRFASYLAAAALPGAIYAALMLSGDGYKDLAYGWAAVPVTLGWLAIRASLGGSSPGGRHQGRAWSARRSTAPRIPRARTR